jgi:hypothetical protein
MTTYYRVDLQNGITVENHPTGLLEGFGIVGKTAFRQMDSAKRAFDKMTNSELARLRILRKKIKAVQIKAVQIKAGFQHADMTPPLLKQMNCPHENRR